MLVGISSPYRRVGLMHAKHKQYFATDSDDTLVVQGQHADVQSRRSTPAAIAAQQEADPTAARSEWDAQFRADLIGFLDDELIEQAIDHGRPLELPPRAGVFYKAYVDARVGLLVATPTASQSPTARTAATSSTSCAGVPVPSTRRS